MIRRGSHCQCAVPSQVLVAFGRDDALNYITSCEVWDPTSGTFNATLAGSVATPRFAHDAVMLSDGRTLAAGGWWLWQGLPIRIFR